MSFNDMMKECESCFKVIKKKFNKPLIVTKKIIWILKVLLIVRLLKRIMITSLQNIEDPFIKNVTGNFV